MIILGFKIVIMTAYRRNVRLVFDDLEEPAEPDEDQRSCGRTNNNDGDEKGPRRIARVDVHSLDNSMYSDFKNNESSAMLHDLMGVVFLSLFKIGKRRKHRIRP